MSQNEQWKNHRSNSPHVKAEGIPNQSPSNSHLEVIHSSTLTPSPPSPMDPVFIAEHQLFSMDYPSLQCRSATPAMSPTQPLAQHQPTLWGGGWAEWGKKEKVPKLGDNS